jgi:hypothetical protein
MAEGYDAQMGALRANPVYMEWLMVGTYTHGVVAISVAVHDVGRQVWSPCGGRRIKKAGPGEMVDVREMLSLQWKELILSG